MTTKSKIASVPLTGVTIAYYLTLAAIFLASTFPTYRVWGLNWWAYFPLWVRIGLLAVGLVMPLVIDRVLNRLLSDRDDISARTYRWLVGGFAVVMIALFYLLRARTYFLGDGYQLLSTLGSENPFIRPRNLGGMLIQHAIFKLLNGEGEPGALLAYQTVSIAAGISFIGITIWAATRLISQYMERFLFVLLTCTGGYALMFFGYVENYSFFVVLVAAFCLLSLLIIDKKVGRLWIIPLLAVASIFHIFGVVLTLPTLYLLLYDTALWDKLSRWPAQYKILLSVLVLGILGTVFAYSYTTSWFFRLSLLPLWRNTFTVEGYTLFSTAHLVDFLNLVLLLFPGLLVIAVALFHGWRLTGASWFSIVSIALIAFSCAGTAFVFDPKLGMPRDWDLFSFAGVPLILGLAYLLLNVPSVVSRK